MASISTKPYHIRALHEWCTDSGYTPYLVVLVDERSIVPNQYVEDNQIVLNISILATQALELGNDLIQFSARFGGVEHRVSVAVDAVLAVFARETGEGMSFEVLDSTDHDDPDDLDESHPPTSSKPKLKLV